MIFALAYGSSSGSSNWNATCDLEPDDKIDFEDLMVFAMNYGEISELISYVEAQAITYQATSMDKLQEKVEQLAVEGKIQDSYRLNELSPSGKGITQHAIYIEWHSYPDVTGYRLYRRVNDGELMFLDLLAPSGYSWYYFYDNNVSEGNTYTYYVTAYGSGWETDPSPTVSIDTWLPPCSLISPADQSIITDPTTIFTWNPVGLEPTDFPYGSISIGESDLCIYDTIASEITWSLWFNDLTAASATYNQDGYATPLVSGHTYIWDSWGYGYDSAGNLIAISQSEDWEFFYNDGIIPEIIIN